MSFRNSLTPDPGQHKDWQKWARSFLVWFRENQLDEKHEAPVRVPIVAVAELPTASEWTGCLLFVSNSDSTPTQVLAVSDGTNWRRVELGTVVS